MTDVVKRLREQQNANPSGIAHQPDLYRDAADEIELLRKKVSALVDVDEMRLRTAIAAVSSYCKLQPVGSSPHDMIYSQRLGIAKTVVDALRLFDLRSNQYETAKTSQTIKFS